MGESRFSFKQFSIQQDACGMKVSQDGCLFGTWASFEGAGRLLDIGTGTGLLSLMLAQRYPAAQIDAVELDLAACQQAKQNFKNSSWEERIQLFRTKIQEFSPGKAYEGIICNPPFFPNHLQAKEAGRNLARHTNSLSFQELCKAISRLLQENGKACLMHKPTAFFPWLRQQVFHYLHEQTFNPGPKSRPTVLLSVCKNQ